MSNSFKQHFDMISMHEPVTRKARFWSSYVGALKGTQDMRADDSHSRSSRLRPASESFDLFPSRLFGEDNLYSADPASRINAPGYRYQPVSRDTYGYTPRSINSIDRPSRFLASRK